MDLMMNGLLLAATCFAGAYCWVLARRVRELKSLDRGLGGAIVTLTRQIELARTTLEEARASSRETKAELGQLVQRAEAAAGQLRLLLAAGGPARAAEGAGEAEARKLWLAAGGDSRADGAEVPKPRAVGPVENPLRRLRRGAVKPATAEEPVAAAAAGAKAREDAILDALSALAGGR